jgi:signal transduction histidine kinase
MEAAQRERWGLDAQAIARRLCRAWNLPRWLSAVIAGLDLTADSAAAVGVDSHLIRIAQLAAHLAQGCGSALGLRTGGDADSLCQELGIASADRGELEKKCQQILAAPVPESGRESQPLLEDLLQVALEHRRLSAAPRLSGLDDDADRLHLALRHQQKHETERLTQLKIRALAEFAGGAGHEINNPLAVISGQAQYLLAQEPDPARQRSLQKIIGQAQRIHQILTDLMQFARPSQPQKESVNVASLLAEARARVLDLATARSVRLECRPVEPLVYVHADLKHAQAALTALLRNAVEAAPAEGWAGVRVVPKSENQVDLVVEDSGTGPSPAQIEHLFDPFYSGRQAGRGRGLGLPTAWQLARVNGGAVTYTGTATGVTQFVLSLPGHAGPEAISASATGFTLPAALPTSEEIMPLNGHANGVASADS